ncbi:UNVERIFIED_CONTAM: Retrovirus-related Pol polyprotein from transposon TNT 1-94 [Sesamum angustifolium]|uniref:Retrovirus-related Pol polyprotein from transposon TNT 1-94 n=1 Tax=Sesamum angustifolium TaxID=2727405 RepID=A0AAW2QCL1_9LAMI
MKGILIQQKVFKSIDGKYAENVSDDKKRDNDEYAYSSIILNLSDSVIRKVGKQNSAKELWDRLEELFTETSLPSKLFLLEKFFRYKLDMSKNIDENIDEFTKLVQDIKLTGDKNIDDYTPIVLLNAIPDTYSDVKAAIKYGLGDVCLTFSDGYKLTLRNVRYVPDLNHNLMSCAALEEEGLEGRWGKGIMKSSVTKVFPIYVMNVVLNVTRLTPIPLNNGVAERMNRTLLEKVRCMLISSGLPKSFWGETLVTAAFLINRSPSVPLNGQIPESVWTGNAVDISSLRVFGCSAFVHQSVDKLAPRSQKCVFIGYPDGIKGYRLWLRSQPGFKVLISKDVIFNENEMPCLDDSQDKNNDNLDLTFNKVEDNQQGEGNEEEPSTVFPENTNSEGLDDYLLARDRNRREPRIPARYNDFHIALNVEPNEPSSVEEALKSENSKNWLSAMAEEK